MSEINTDLIISELEGAVKAGFPISPVDWIEKAVRLNILLSDEQAKLFELQQQVAQQQMKLVEEGKNVGTSKVIIQASDTYKEMLIQKAKIERVIEFVRLAKHRSRLAQDEFRGNV